MERVSSHPVEKVESSSEQLGTVPHQHPSSSCLHLPQKTLIVLCGPAGAGKSTFARRFVETHQDQGCRATTVVSSDFCRAMICDDEANQHINRDTFDLFYFIIRKRLFLGHLTIADSTALLHNARQNLLDMARRFQYHTCLVVFNMSHHTCMDHDQHQARGRVVGEQVITYHLSLLRQAMVDIPKEGWDHIVILDEQQSNLSVRFVP